MFSKDTSHYSMACPQCGDDVEASSFAATLVGYSSPPGHDHDFNWLTPMYQCPSCSLPGTTYTWNGGRFRSACWCGKGADEGAGFELTGANLNEYRGRRGLFEKANETFSNPGAREMVKRINARSGGNTREKELYAAERYVKQYCPKELVNPMLVLLRECSRLGMNLECIEPEGGALLLGSNPNNVHAIKFVVYPEASDRPRWHGIPHAFTMKLEPMHDPDLAKIEYEILRRANAKALADHVADMYGQQIRKAARTTERILDDLCDAMENLEHTKDIDAFFGRMCESLSVTPGELLARTRFAKSELFQIAPAVDPNAAIPEPEAVTEANVGADAVQEEYEADVRQNMGEPVPTPSDN